MKLAAIADAILDEGSSREVLRSALDAFVFQCAQISGVYPDPSFNAWANDALLESGVAINPHAAAHCAIDYQRSVVFIRGVHAAINTLKSRFPGAPLKILYAGCGPFATLLMPLLNRYAPHELQVTLLDIHQASLDSVTLLLSHFELGDHQVNTVKADACLYQHAEPLHLVVAETMQKSLEQEPQVAVTANLAPQLLPAGFFIPQRIDITLCVINPEHENTLCPLAVIFELTAEHAPRQAKYNHQHKALKLDAGIIEIPPLADIAQRDAALLSHITVFEQYCLKAYDSEITLPAKCHGLAPLLAGARYRVSYLLGSYPRFNIEPLENL
tara:strand:- start:49344 stop:50327 length:984 start_codon:yes stop_codon:yes gene_type:complete